MDSPRTISPAIAINAALPDADEDQIEEEIPPLQYARENGLARDHLADTLCFSELAKLQRALLTDVAEDSELPTFDFGNEFKVEERVTISKEGALLLASVAKEETVEVIDAIILPMLRTKSGIQGYKFELPLLRSDHETDCRNFAKRDGFEIKLEDVKLPLELVDAEKNEGSVWPSRYSNLGAEVLKELSQEKISVSKDVMVHLQTTLKSSWTKEDDLKVRNSEQKYKRSTAREPVTPPLSPLPTPFEPYEPSMSDPAMQLPILSDASSPTKYVLEALEAKILQQDVPTTFRKSTAQQSHNPPSDTSVEGDTITLGEIYSPLASLENTPPSVEIHRIRRDDLKVEEPLTPDNPVPVAKSVHFSDIIEGMETTMYPESTSNSLDYQNSFFEEAFGEASNIATQRSEQERLIEADSTARVDTPVMDFSKPDPPWKAFEQKRGSSSLLEMQRDFLREHVGPQRSWMGVEKFVTKLNWVPFPHNLGKVALEEPIEDKDSTWEAFVRDPSGGEVINSSSLTWKPPGLRILKDEDDDDEIEPGKFVREGAQDLSSLIKKRKMELDRNEDQSEMQQANSKKQIGHLLQKPAKPNDFTTAAQMHVNQSFGQGFGLLGGHFSAANSIDNYLELRGAKKPKLTDSSYFIPGSKDVQPPSKSQASKEILKAQTAIQLPIRKSPVSRKDPLPAPLIQSPGTKTNLIISTTLFKQRNLIKSLEALLPGLAIVERDFTAHNSTIWMPGSVTRSPIKSNLDSEADIIVSPSMGILITTLQKIKQKPLPGQKTKSAIRERLEQVSTRYEKLALYVSEGRADESSTGLDGNDCLAFSSFAGFALGLNPSITVQFVGGGEGTLSKWLASTIAENRVTGDSDLLQEETHWELFLRRAGMNAFAAQAVISELKAPDGVDPTSPTKAGLFGLAAFVDMAAEQRIVRFGPLFGRSLLERVSAVIDANWR